MKTIICEHCHKVVVFALSITKRYNRNVKMEDNPYKSPKLDPSVRAISLKEVLIDILYFVIESLLVFFFLPLLVLVKTNCPLPRWSYKLILALSLLIPWWLFLIWAGLHATW